MRPPVGQPPGLSLVIVLAAVTFVAPLSLHMFFPATPSVKSAFGVDEATAQLTVSAPMFAMAVLTLVYGSLSDRLGRRRVLLGGILLFTAGSATCTLADSIELLVAGRLVQAAGGACGLALARAIARDVFGTDRLVKVIAYLTMAYTLGPMISAPVGGWLVDLYGWRGVVVLATAAGLVLAVLAYMAIYETHAPTAGVARKSSYLTDYFVLFRDPRFAGFVMQSAGCTGAFFATATGASFLMTEYLHRPAAEYGLYFMMFPCGFLTGNFISSRLSGRIQVETMVFAGSLILVMAAGTMAALLLAGVVSPLALFGPGCLITFSQGIALPNGQAGAIRAAGTLAGTAAGAGVFMQMAGGGLFTQLYGHLADGTPVPLIVCVSLGAGIGFVAGATPFALSRRRGRPT